jgi:hypothetical protein
MCSANGAPTPGLFAQLADSAARSVALGREQTLGRIQKVQNFRARRSRACAYLADDDHGPLALQEILLAGCPTVGVRTGASFVRDGGTGVVVERLPPGRQCVETDKDVRALAVFMEAIEQAQAMDRHSVRERAAERFATHRIIDDLVSTLNTARFVGSIQTAVSV